MLKDILYEKTQQRLLAKELETNKATVLATWCPMEHSGSLMRDTETLCRSPRGDYFIVYEGGLHASFHNLDGVESWFGGTYIRTVTPEEAIAWCEETGNTDTIKSHLPFAMMVLERRLASTDRTPA